MKIRFTIAFLLFSLATIAQTAVPPPAISGILGAPYHIASAANLYWLSQNSNEWNTPSAQSILPATGDTYCKKFSIG